MFGRILSRSFCQRIRAIAACLVVLGVLVYARRLVVMGAGESRENTNVIQVTQGYTTLPRSQGGQHFLDKMLIGHWMARNYTQQEMAELETFIKRVWTYYKIPLTLQREDKKCGSVSFPGLKWFRALCNPEGSAPCCMNSSCVNKTVNECQCPDCHDMRSQIHAELATWVPNDTNFKMTKFTSENDVCRVLHNKTVHFIGDSFMRQLYTSVLAMLRHSKPRHVIRDNVPLVNLTNCDKFYRFTADCRNYLIWSTKECNGTATLSMKSVYRAENFDGPFKSVRELNGTVNSWLVVGVGAHDYYNTTAVIRNLVDPLLTFLQNSSWPKLIWMAAHSPGLLKTGAEKRQQSQVLKDYNEKLKLILGPLGIPILNFFDLTKGIFSFDGAHYGKGLNDVKVNILLNVLQQETMN